MGVKGLTTYIAKKAEQYLEPFELHDTDLVIDGDNLASQLYKRADHNLSAFGGLYDQYFRTIVDFFNLLKKCNVTSYVLLDGGYENRKMKTVKERLRGKIATVKYITPLDNRIAIPIMMREVFVEAMKYCNISFMRCLFEADDEIAILARKLKCPVLSYDSDFYIHNVLYIPYVSLTLKVYKKTVVNEENYEIEVLQKKTKNKKLKNKNNPRVVVKDGKSFAVKHNSKNDVVEGSTENTSEETYCYIDCCLYKIENLAKSSKLKEEMLPLFATLLGNDYIERRMFRKFYAGVKLQKSKKKQSSQQRRIAVMIDWLRHETLKSAIMKVVNTMKITERDRLVRQIETAMGNYSREESEAFDFFGFEEQENTPKFENLNIDLNKLIAEAEIQEEELTDSENEEDDEELNDEEEDNSDVEDDEDEDNGKEEHSDKEDVDANTKAVENVSNDNGLITDDENVDADKICKREENFEFPSWFTTLFMNGHLPRCVLDLFYTKMYINYPQVEDLTIADSNELSYPLLLFIFSILHSPEKRSFYYVTRILRYARFFYKKFDIPEMPDISYNFDDKSNNLKIFKNTFSILPGHETIFPEINKHLPNNFKLYVLCVVYWMQQCKRTNTHFLQSALIGLIALSVVDKKCTFAHRDLKVFEKKFSAQLNQLVDEPNELEETCIINLIKSIDKNEALHAQHALIPLYSLSDKFQRKHADFNRSVVHVFAELQSVVFNYYIISALLNYPFDNIRISECINGLFLYNIYLNLRGRTNSLDYIKQILFKKSPHISAVFQQLYDLCMKLLPNLEDHKLYIPKLAKKNNLKNITSRKNAVQVKKDKTKQVGNDKVTSSSDETDNDLLFNNKFRDLLKLE